MRDSISVGGWSLLVIVNKLNHSFYFLFSSLETGELRLFR
jgi:hypothetical protein